MKRYPSLTWEYGPKTREILAARDLAAFLEKSIDWDEYEEVTLLLRDPRGGETAMARKTHGPGVRKKPQPQPIKSKPGKKDTCE
jgi:hypothetical protein